MNGLRVFAAEFAAARCEKLWKSERLMLPDFVLDRSLIAHELIAFFSDLHGEVNIHLVLLECCE